MMVEQTAPSGQEASGLLVCTHADRSGITPAAIINELLQGTSHSTAKCLWLQDCTMTGKHEAREILTSCWSWSTVCTMLYVMFWTTMSRGSAGRRSAARDAAMASFSVLVLASVMGLHSRQHLCHAAGS